MTEIAATDRRSMSEDGDAEGGNSDEILAGNESFGCSLFDEEANVTVLSCKCKRNSCKLMRASPS